MPAVSRKNKKQAKKPTANKEPTKSVEATTVVSGQLQKQIKNKKRKPRQERGLVFIKNLPKGFEEEQLRGYFSQFGHITNLRLVRSRRTGNSKGFAYIQFLIPEVAKIAADTMANYLMFQKIVKATYIPPEQQKYNYFRSTVKCVQNPVGKPIFVSSKTKQINKCVNAYNKWDDETYVKRTKAALKKIRMLKKKHEDAGLDFDTFILEPGFKKDAEQVPGQDTSGSLLLVKEQDKSPETASQKAKKGQKKLKKGRDLDLLLGQSLLDDTDDEDFVPAKVAKKSAEVMLQNTAKGQKKQKKVPDLLSLIEQELPEEDTEDEDFIPDEDVSEDLIPAKKSKRSQEVKLQNTKKGQKNLKKKKDLDLLALVNKEFPEEDPEDEDFVPAKASKKSPEIKSQNKKTGQTNSIKSKTAQLLSIIDPSFLGEDSEDEEFVPSEISEIDISSSDAEIDALPENEISESEEENVPISKKGKKNNLRPMMDGFEKIIQRKNAGIQKPNKKEKAKITTGKQFSAKSKLVSNAAKEIMKNEKVKILNKKDLKKTKKRL